MKKNNKILVMIATTLIIIGLFSTFIGLALGAHHSLTIDSGGIRVVGGKRIVETKDLEAFKNVKIDAEISKIQLIPSDHYGIDYSYLEKSEKLELDNTNDTLEVKQTSRNRFFNINFGFFNFNRNENYIKIYYPKDVNLEDINIETKMGSVKIDGVSANTLTVNSHMGSVEIRNGKFGNANFDLNMGDLELDQLNFTTIVMNLSMGNIEGDDITSNGLKATSNMGDIEIDGTFYGKNTLDCSMGSIIFDTTLTKNLYRYNISTNMGNVNIDGSKVGNNTTKSDGENEINASSNMGSININFSK